MKTAKSRKGCINDPNLTYQADPREVKLRKIINGEANNMEDGVFPTIESNGITKLGDSFVFERTDPDAPGLKEPENPRKATNVYMYKIKKAIKFAYQISTNGRIVTGKQIGRAHV